MHILMVFIGGGLGSICRYLISKSLYSLQWSFPLATFLANVLSCMVLGLVLGWHLKNGLSLSYRLLILTGFCGGFSTFSTFSNESLELLQLGLYAQFFLNAFLSIGLCMLCIWLGVRVVVG